MSVKFEIREKLYANITFEVESDDKDLVDAELDKIGDGVSADDLYNHLTNVFGYDNVKTEGLNDSDNIYPADEYEFEDWIEE